MTRFVSWALSAVLAMTLVACGFQLRGLYTDTQHQYPFASIYIDSNLSIAREVADRLKLDPRIKLLNSAKDAEAVLRISSEKKSKDLQTINRSGQATEYRLNYMVTAKLLMNGEQIGKDIVLKQFRTMTYADSAILGKDQEESLLWSDMSHTTAQLLLFRLSSNNMAREVASAAAGEPKPKAVNASSQP